MKTRAYLTTILASGVLSAGLFSVASAATPLVVAGGGGGSGYDGTNGDGGQITTSGSAGFGPGGGAGGVGGAGGAGGNGDGGLYNGGGGAGWVSSGTAGAGGFPTPGEEGTGAEGGLTGPSFAGGLGGNIPPNTANGGYGGGGGGGWQGGGGGGGYSGGGGGDGSDDGGGGGGSYVDPAATLLSAIPGFNGVNDSDGGTMVGNNGYLTINGALFSYTGALQSWVVPLTGLYDIVAVGAQGGGSEAGAIGGYGAGIEALDFLTAGTDLSIVVGGAGNYGDFDGVWGGGGGGGTFLFTGSFVPEPATWAFMFAGVGGIGLMLRRARKTTGSYVQDSIAC